MRTLTDFANSMETLADTLPTIVSAKAIETTTEIVSDLAGTTPADTGAAISNWQVSLDAPIEAPVGPFNPSARGRMIQGEWTHMVDPAITRANNAPQTIEQARAILSSRQPGQPIFITNVLRYARLLNQGSSEQAPAGFVDRAIILAREVIDKFRFIR